MYDTSGLPGGVSRNKKLAIVILISDSGIQQGKLNNQSINLIQGEIQMNLKFNVNEMNQTQENECIEMFHEINSALQTLAEYSSQDEFEKIVLPAMNLLNNAYDKINIEK